MINNNTAGRELPSRILLTVAIPTFNGAGSIARALSSVLSQAVLGIEVLVSDNCSLDATASTVAAYKDLFPCVNYYRNSRNLGYDRNVDLAMRRARGDFVWLLGDDDIILPGAIDIVLNAISANADCGVIYVNYPHANRLRRSSGRVLSGGDEFFDRTLFKSGFVSANIFKKSLWLDLNVSKYFDTGWIHVGFVIEALITCDSYVMAEFCVTQTHEIGKATRWGRGGSFIYTGLELVQIYRRLSEMPYSRRTRRRAYWSIKAAYWRNIPLAKAQGFKSSIPVLRLFFRSYKGFVSFWLVDLPLLLVPRVVYRVLFLAYTKANRLIF